MNSKTSKWDKKVIIGIVGLLIIIGLAWATIIISLNNKSSGVVVTPMGVEGEPSDRPDEEIKDFLIIGSAEVGYISVPESWSPLNVEGVPENGYAYGDESKGEMVIFGIVDSGGASVEEYAKNVAARIESEGGNDVSSSGLVIGVNDVHGFEVSYLDGETLRANRILYYASLDGRIGMIHIKAMNRDAAILEIIRDSFELYRDDNSPSPMDEAVDPDDGVDVMPGEEE